MCQCGLRSFGLLNSVKLYITYSPRISCPILKVSSLHILALKPQLRIKITGTPFLPTALTMYGIHIGRDCYLETYDFPEPDCVHIGDRVEINSLSEIQPHVYEDRVKKIDHTFIGNDVTIGIRSNILVGAKVGNSCQIGPLSLAMKGEAVPGNMSWVGVPLKPWMQKQFEHQSLSSDEDQSLVLV